MPTLLKKKQNRINQWIFRGLNESREYIEQIYEEYLSSEECQLCGEVYSIKNNKNMDHCHETGKFRNIVCKRCNKWKLGNKAKYIFKEYKKKEDKYVFRIQVVRNGKRVICKERNNYEKALEVLNQFILDNPQYFT